MLAAQRHWTPSTCSRPSFTIPGPMRVFSRAALLLLFAAFPLVAAGVPPPALDEDRSVPVLSLRSGR